ncbi:hypothetical protein [Acetobacterium malicum]|uniref:hypothetical protein n=1 Tax=Acetobacterium malicum TaxID=52692 RepID=UPI00047BDFF3|nr:hypothetical protein [Acetobacterium dehalogenans]
MSEKSQENTLLSEIVEYGKYALDLEIKREESLITQANQMTTAFSFSTAALYILFQIGLEHYNQLTKDYLLYAVALITFLLLLCLLFAFLASWRWKQNSFYSANDFFEYVSKNEKKFLENDYSFLLEWKSAITEKHSRLFELNNRRGLFLKLSMGCFFSALVTVFIFGTKAFIIIIGGSI